MSRRPVESRSGDRLATSEALPATKGAREPRTTLTFHEIDFSHKRLHGGFPIRSSLIRRALA